MTNSEQVYVGVIREFSNQLESVAFCASVFRIFHDVSPKKNHIEAKTELSCLRVAPLTGRNRAP